jgi:tetratricopeptide (TPR) repeat protein
MSTVDEEEAADEVCANCGKAEVDEVKLKICTACKLVKYCSVECQKNHRKQHKKACKKREAELRNDKLFRQPDESYLGECPICCLPLPLDRGKWLTNSCCCKYICSGCAHANHLREEEEGLEHKCAFCREPVPKTKVEANQNLMKRVKANDPLALCRLGNDCFSEGDVVKAFKYYEEAAALGDMSAHFNLSVAYREGGVVEKNLKKEIYHLEVAAIGGHPKARVNLGIREGQNGRYERTVKHFIIAAKLGDDKALEMVKENFRRGFVSKEDFDAALRGHQAAVDATKSKQREEAYAFDNVSPEEQEE